MREHVGAFTVWKRNGKQRMVVDARLSHLWFGSPEAVSLGTGSSFALIEVDSGLPSSRSGIDISEWGDSARKAADPPRLQSGAHGMGAGAVVVSTVS